MYATDGEGHWTKRVYVNQCGHGFLLGGKCQGAEGHRGNHWRYRECGQYEWHRNDNDKETWQEHIAGGWTPPDHKDYVHPIDKQNDYYVAHYEDSEVTDPSLITRLENGELEEDEASTGPCSEEEIQWLKDEGRLDSLKEENNDD